MSDLMKSVDLRTQLAGSNRMELLTFHLNDEQKYGINVFKIREVMQCPKLSRIEDENLTGIIYLRGSSVGVIDLNRQMFGTPCDTQRPYLIITEFSQSTQALLVRNVDRILNLEWQEIHHPPPTLTNRSRITATTEAAGEVVQIIDVEQLIMTASKESRVDELQLSEAARRRTDLGSLEVVYCDDSVVARKNLHGCLEKLGVRPVGFSSGVDACHYLKRCTADPQLRTRIACLLSDIEMPELDGFTLTNRLREDPALKHLPIYLHSSLSSASSEEKAAKVGADGFIAKFDPAQIASSVSLAIERLPPEAGETP